jgi:hypothetical protein
MDREAFGVLAQGDAGLAVNQIGRPVAPCLPAQRLADPLHGTWVANRMLDQIGRGVKNGRSTIAGASPHPSFAEPEALVERAEDHLDERGRDKILAGLRFGEPRDEARSRVG